MIKKIIKPLNQWAQSHLFGLFMFNIILVMLVLLNVAEYFKPFFFIGINVIFFTSLVLTIFLLGFRSKAMFLISMFFFLFAMFLKIVKIDIWADRASIYFYQAYLLGILLLVIDHKMRV